MDKHKFSHAEKYAIWLHHDKQCWFCKEPLRLAECTIDHVVPEHLLATPDTLKDVIKQYGLKDEFEINGYENWLPCHVGCNQQKSRTVLDYVPGLKLILDRLAKKSPKVAASARAVSQNVKKDKVIARVFSAFEKQVIDLERVPK